MEENLLNIDDLPVNIRLPKWSDFSVRLVLDDENQKAILLIHYKDEEKYRYEIDFGLCQDLPDKDIFSVRIFGVEFTLYLRYFYICVNTSERTIHYKFQVWARSGRVKTKIGEVDEKIYY